jgi:hypothetical protein
MTHENWNLIIDLWNSGKSIREISRRTGIPEAELGKKLLGAVEQAVRVQSNVVGRQ